MPDLPASTPYKLQLQACVLHWLKIKFLVDSLKVGLDFRKTHLFCSLCRRPWYYLCLGITLSKYQQLFPFPPVHWLHLALTCFTVVCFCFSSSISKDKVGCQIFLIIYHYLIQIATPHEICSHFQLSPVITLTVTISSQANPGCRTFPRQCWRY